MFNKAPTMSSSQPTTKQARNPIEKSAEIHIRISWHSIGRQRATAARPVHDRVLQKSWVGMELVLTPELEGSKA